MLIVTLALLAPRASGRGPGQFVPPHFDFGLDTDHDGLFNFIHLVINVSSSAPGNFFLAVDLKDGSNTTFITSAFQPFPLDGTISVNLDIDGIAIQSSGINGPYNANLYLFVLDTAGGAHLSAYDEHLTRPYLLTDFDPSPARFEPPHSDRGVDRDLPPNSQYNVLEVDARINVTDSGFYFVAAGLFDSTASFFMASGSWVGPLSPGIQSVPLNFSGVTIRSSGFDGPYVVNLYLAMAKGPLQILPLGGGMHTTRPYKATDFEASTPSDLTGTVRDATSGYGIPSANVTAYNYLNDFTITADADATGNYTLHLFAGDWVVTYDNSDHESDLLRLSLPQTTPRNVDLVARGRVVGSADLEFSTWNATQVHARSVNEQDVATFRMAFDWSLGNRDQFLSLQEFEQFLRAFSLLPTLPPNSQDVFLVDGTDFNLVPGSDSFAFVNLTGPIDSRVPPELQLGGSYVANTTIPSAEVHRIDLQVEYDTSAATNVYAVRAPSAFEWVGVHASSAVTVSGLGTQTVIVDPGPSPDPAHPWVTSEWVTLEAVSTVPDTTPPSITDTAVSPNPDELGSATTISTHVGDNRGVGSVKVEVRNPGSVVVGNFTMTRVCHPQPRRPPICSPYTYQFDPQLKGMYTYTITATDTSGNTAVVTGSLLVRDTTPPVAKAGADLTIAAGSTVTFDGEGSSDLDGIVTYTWTFDDNGAKTLSGPKPSYHFDHPGTFTVTLTVVDASGNQATDTVKVTVTPTTGTVDGTVTDANGQFVSQATVKLLNGTTEVATTTTDANGRFSFTNIAPGTYSLQVEGSGYSSRTETVTVTAGQTTTKSVALTSVTISGILPFRIEYVAILVLVVAVLVGVAVVLVRRRGRRPS